MGSIELARYPGMAHATSASRKIESAAGTMIVGSSGSTANSSRGNLNSRNQVPRAESPTSI